MIRKAVGAIVQYNGKFLLVHKVKGAQGKISGVWDFPKGGLESHDDHLEAALLRELKEETGSAMYVIKKQYEAKVSFAFDAPTRQIIGFEKQETTMFLVEYTGDMTDLKTEDDEIDGVRWFTKEDVVRLVFPEARQFFEQYVVPQGETLV
ncbi:NUDIX hydrolase [Paenibacillus allorhizosphaerae]|uniref:RNA pyrophosphohydrolase n=1 Tax=Paenibacillus allorhizosphaerae TaxID=2849866 RepID=A0ABN7TJC5_9BACL|nr:NUDIX hydrolase [Paenibacillus allorhizosphaerae]CAG7637129.1 RNA pyrophosphohydrolase [Paenibacillus allorhizosphaerae]